MLDCEISATRDRLEALALTPSPVPPPSADPSATIPPPVLCADGVPLELLEVQQSTDSFDASRRIGSGGFGQVFVGEPMASLAMADRRVAVKRATPGLELADLRKEVLILNKCAHPHLLPLLGFCMDPSAPCLVFPLMPGGSLQTRLDLAPRDVSYLLKMGHFSEAPRQPAPWD